ncbi:hypothetical protein ABTX82_27885 [Streptomyces lavendulae]|uniref:hypothetical protein n=1 Tax=Streptomyces lavendulae TaxID=1914 RepID=UPI00331F96C2
MARIKPSRLELALIAEVEKHGFAPTATQLERWRQRLWLPRTTKWREPGGVAIRPEIVQRTIDLARHSVPGRSLSWIGWVFWALDDTPEAAEELRKAMLAALERPLARAGVGAGEVPTDDSDEAFGFREELATELLKDRRSPRRDWDRILREHAAEAGVEIPPSRSVPNIFRRSLIEPGARLLVGGVDDAGFEDLLEWWERRQPEDKETIECVRSAHREAALEGVDLLAQYPLSGGLPGLMQVVKEADGRRLCAAVRECTEASGTMTELLIRAVEIPQIIPLLMNDPMWERWARPGGIAPSGAAGEAAVAVSAVQHMLFPWWAEDLKRYQVFLEILLLSLPEDHGEGEGEPVTAQV